MAVTREFLSGAAGGLAIQVTGTATGSAVTVHTAHATAKDEIILYASNTSASEVVLTIEWGGTGTANELKMKVPAEDSITAVIGTLSGSNVVKAYAATGSVINVYGHVNRIA